MNLTERLTVIKQISEKMAQEDWPTIDFVLQHCSLPTNDNWTGNKQSYALKMLVGASDQVLYDLSRHYNIASSPIRSKPLPDFWIKEQYRLFISHISSQKLKVKALQESLSCCGISAFVAHIDITPSKEWQDQIEEALHTCEGLLAYLSSDFHESDWTDQEVGFAISRGIRIIPLDCGSLPYGLMGKYQALKSEISDSKDIAIEIMKLVMNDARDGPPISDLVINNLESSRDFATSSYCMTALGAIPILSPVQLNRIKTAYKKNDQFWGVMRMENRIGRLFETHGQKFE